MEELEAKVRAQAEALKAAPQEAMKAEKTDTDEDEENEDEKKKKEIEEKVGFQSLF